MFHLPNDPFVPFVKHFRIHRYVRESVASQFLRFLFLEAPKNEIDILKIGFEFENLLFIALIYYFFESEKSSFYCLDLLLIQKSMTPHLLLCGK